MVTLLHMQRNAAARSVLLFARVRDGKNVSSKTLGLAKFWSKFMHLVVRFFLAVLYRCMSQMYSLVLTRLSKRIDFYKAGSEILEMWICLFVFINDI